MAYERFRARREEGYDRVCERTGNSGWQDYCLYMTIKNQQGGKPWNEWEPALRDRQPEALEEAKRCCWEDIEFYRFQQYEFFKQWNDLHSYANRNGIRIIGDLPIYVAFDSADTWSMPKLFQFTEDHKPKAVAGCPPDGFGRTLQTALGQSGL